ncbi:PH domain-containing protein [Pedobacter sp.]|uniref:PH domain-containing protein n=1 Tax=Pedobacter sp. TaxID=1411316 RepID=UPI003D7FD6DA
MSYLVWMWHDTYYLIDDNQLLYKSALLRGSIDISSIVEIEKNKKIYAGVKPSLSNKGVVIKYNKWDDIFMSPIDIDHFISALKDVNPGIRTIE